MSDERWRGDHMCGDDCPDCAAEAEELEAEYQASVPATASRSIEDVLTDEDRARLDEARPTPEQPDEDRE